jgi:hypothetical protein
VIELDRMNYVMSGAAKNGNCTSNYRADYLSRSLDRRRGAVRYSG